jgi:hypothetical protein
MAYNLKDDDYDDDDDDDDDELGVNCIWRWREGERKVLHGGGRREEDSREKTEWM